MTEILSTHEVLIVPGLSDGMSWPSWMVRNWNQKYGLTPSFHTMPWKDSSPHFEPKLQRFLSEIDSLTKKGKRVSLIGTSAGGSAVLNAFTLRQNDIHKVVNICGRLKTGENTHPTLEQAGKNSASFIESVQMFEEAEKSLDYDVRKNILTVRPLYDEIVPISTMAVEGSCDLQIISVEHMLNIAVALTLYSKQITNFLNDV